MTTEELASAPPRGERGARTVACSFCRRRLADEYYFTCRRCDESYCYIHMSRHLPARCQRRTHRDPPRPVLVAGAGRGRSSANV